MRKTVNTKFFQKVSLKNGTIKVRSSEKFGNPDFFRINIKNINKVAIEITFL